MLRRPLETGCAGRAPTVDEWSAPRRNCIPAQDFVQRYEVESVLGCGGQLPDGELYAVIAFARVTISRESAEIFKPLALAAKLALLPFLSTTFAERPDVASAG